MIALYYSIDYILPLSHADYETKASWILFHSLGHPGCCVLFHHFFNVYKVSWDLERLAKKSSTKPIQCNIFERWGGQIEIELYNSQHILS